MSTLEQAVTCTKTLSRPTLGLAIKVFVFQIMIDKSSVCVYQTKLPRKVQENMYVEIEIFGLQPASIAIHEKILEVCHRPSARHSQIGH